MQTIGPYDKYCMRYGYADLAGATEDARHASLLALAAEADGDPRLSRSDDYDEIVSNDPRARKYDFSADTVGWCDEQATMTKRFLAALDPDDETQAERHGLDAVWARTYPYVYGLAGRSLRMWWHYCGAILPTYVRGLDYDRTRLASLATPVAREERERALATLIGALTDDALAMPPRAVTERAAEFEDDEFKWGLKAGYDEWLQSAHDERETVLDALVDAKHLRWVDTLASRDAAAANFTSVATLEAVTEALVTQPILEWAEFAQSVDLCDTPPPSVPGWLGDDPTGGHRALLAAWVDRLCAVYQGTSSGDAAKAWLKGSRTPPFNYPRVHSGVRQILANVQEKLQENLVQHAECGTPTPSGVQLYQEEITPFIEMIDAKLDYYLTYWQFA